MNTRMSSMIKLVLCMVAVAMLMSSHAFAILIDGNVKGFSEGYTSGYNVSFNIENGPQGVPGGSLFFAEDLTTMYAGIILPLNIVDNTYGDTRASDWGGIAQSLSNLEGSDKWEFKYAVSGTEIELKLDYIEEIDGAYNARIEKFKEGGVDLVKSKIAFATSLDYNYNVLGLTEFFSGTEIASPRNPYDFDDPSEDAEDWIPEIMYEFSIDKSAFSPSSAFSNSDWFVLNSSVIHASPNKLGDKGVFPILGDPISSVPEPAAMLLLGFGLIGLAVIRRKFRKS